MKTKTTNNHFKPKTIVDTEKNIVTTNVKSRNHNNYTEAETHLYTKAAILSQILLELIDELRDTPLCIKNVKHNINILEKNLTKEIGYSISDWDKNEGEAFRQLSIHHESFLDKFTRLSPRYINIVSDLIDVIEEHSISDKEDKGINKLVVLFNKEADNYEEWESRVKSGVKE